MWGPRTGRAAADGWVADAVTGALSHHRTGVVQGDRGARDAAVGVPFHDRATVVGGRGGAELEVGGCQGTAVAITESRRRLEAVRRGGEGTTSATGGGRTMDEASGAAGAEGGGLD
jgi:hypothetical protein